MLKDYYESYLCKPKANENLQALDDAKNDFQCALLCDKDPNCIAFIASSNKCRMRSMEDLAEDGQADVQL